MSHPDWNDSYAAGDMPWDTGEPDDNLVEFVRSGAVAPGRALEVGCGTGTDVLWLARQGFVALGIDIAPLAVEQARAKAAEAKLDCRFESLDLLSDDVSGGPFDFVFDRGCFHVFDEADERARFAERVAAILAPNGRWLSLIGSTEGPARDWGPPRRTARDVVGAIEPALEILELRAVEFQAPPSAPTAAWAAWFCLSRPRKVPAVPSTQSD
ncbi:MAG: class I SAM-dependent methyltransferase [Gammaproteobacteria bacterium]